MNDRTNWTQISKNPTSESVHNFLLQTIRNRRAGVVGDLMGKIEHFTKDYTVLDIGVVEHDLSHMSSPDWKHAKIKKWAKDIVGVDILGPETEELKRQGYTVECMDATAAGNLGRKFERIVLADVIEHVDNPVGLLKFAARHLENNGQILVSTPNPFRMGFFLRNLKEGTFIANAEHMFWITPSMALEVARRANVELKEYWLCQGSASSFPKQVFRSIFSKIWPESEVISGQFIYIFEKNDI